MFGLFDGAAVELVMNLIVLPLSAETIVQSHMRPTLSRNRMSQGLHRCAATSIFQGHAPTRP